MTKSRLLAAITAVYAVHCVTTPAKAQTLLREYWLGLDGSTLSDLTNNPAYPDYPSGSNYVGLFESPPDWGDSYGTRLRGFVVPPATGLYTFWISSDDQSELYLSTDENPATKTRIARVATWTASRVWEEPRDGNDLVQKSSPVLLEVGLRYYVEAIQKEGAGGDNLAVGWQLPDGTYERPIPGIRLAAWEYSTSWPNIVRQPANLELVEGQRASFRVSVQGAYPMWFQWEHNGTNIPGGTNQTHVIARVALADDGAEFRCVVSNAMGASTSAVARLTVQADTNAPVLATITPAPGAHVSWLSELQLAFSEPVSDVDAADLLINGQPATNVTGQASGPYVFRFDPVADPGSVQVAWAENHGIHDYDATPKSFADAGWSYVIDPVLPTGLLRCEVWEGIQGVTIGDLTGTPAYPASPTRVSFLTQFEAPANWGDNYGTRLRGYVHPPMSGDYVFYIATDDQGFLYLSSDETPSSKALVATVPSWVGSRVWQETRDGIDAQQRSAPIRLDGGRRYYIEALQKEGGGGDNIAVAWRLPDGTFEGPIPGSRLSHWQNSTKPPNILAEPEDATVAEGEAATFRVSVNGGEPLYFLWWRDGLILDGERTPALTLPNLTTNDSGSSVQCVISNSFGAVTSRLATLTVHPEAVPPVVTQFLPPPNGTVRHLSQVEVTFSEAVSGVNASDLLVNGVPATNVAGLLAGPYVFQFHPADAGTVRLEWSPDHGIVDKSAIPNPFSGDAWTNQVDPAFSMGDLVISEFLAANQIGLKDEDGETQDWLEIWNRGSNAVDLAGWALTDDADNPDQWTFPTRLLGAGDYLVVFASGKDRRPSGSGSLHANFRLSLQGEYLGLSSPETPRVPVCELRPAYPEQRNDYSYGLDPTGRWRHFQTPTPGAANVSSSITGLCATVHFSVSRGFFSAPFNVLLSTVTPGATIRYTTNASEPTDANGTLYTGPIRIAATTLLRAAAFKPDSLPSATETHTYFYGLSTNLRSLPVLSVVTDSNNVWGPTGIIGISGGTYTNGYWEPTSTNDYHNPQKHGIAWERPTSVELIHPHDNSGFQVDCGIRTGGGDYIRPRLTPSSKFTFHLYFRSDYGPGKLTYPFFTNSAVTVFDQLVLRAGMNDPDNPFIRDELGRRLLADVGQVSAHGNIVNLFVNGQYKGYYNPTERIEEKFCQSWHGGGPEWDVISVGSSVQDGDTSAWNALRGYVASANMSDPASFLEVERRFDLVNFADYLLVNIVAGTGDWGWNNWRAARERAPDGRFRYYMWDAEWAWGAYGRAVDINSFSNELAAGSSEMGALYHKLRQSQEFRLLFADRIQKHMFNGGRLMETNITARFNALKSQMAGVLPNMDVSIVTSWVPNRRAHLNRHFQWEGVWPGVQAPLFSHAGGRVSAGYSLAMSVTNGLIYYTTNGNDPRTRFTSSPAGDALPYTNGSPLRLFESTVVRARTLAGTNWSALTEAQFLIGRLDLPMRITEVMYNPPGGDAYEFFELSNVGTAFIDLSGFRFSGVEYQFPQGSVLAPRESLVLISDADPALFHARYPAVTVAGTYGRRLDNGGERIALLDLQNNIVLSVDYQDANGWPTAADGGGCSLVLADPQGDLDAAASWLPSPALGGTPGVVDAILPVLPPLRLNEVMTDNQTAFLNGTNYPDYVELFNGSTQQVILAGWSLTDDSNARKFVVPDGVALPGGTRLVIWCDLDTNAPGLHTGFGLDREGDNVFLFDPQTNRVDAISFGQQLADFSIGRSPRDAMLWVLNLPTPSQENQAAPLAAVTNVVLNEWMANPPAGSSDWLELYNRDTNQPVALQGVYLGNGAAIDQIRALSFLAPGGHHLLWCDERSGRDHLDFKLPAAGSRLLLYDETGVLLDQINNPAQAEGVSRGRSPDGNSSVASFYGRATPGAPNALPSYSGVLLSEFMARNATAVTNSLGIVVDWVELYNPTSNSISLSGYSLSVNENQPGQWVFPAGLTMGSRDFLIVWCDADRPPSTEPGPNLNLGRTLNDASGGVYLFDRNRQLVDVVEYGPQVIDRSLGKIANNWRLQSTPSPGASNAPAATLGVVANLKLNEWMANPATGNDWFEIHNADTLPVQLSGIYFSDDPSFAGQTRFLVPALSFIAPRGWVKWEADGEAGQGRNHVNFQLDGDGECLRIYQAGGYVIDSVDFGLQPQGISQGRLPDGTSNLVSFPTTPTPGAMNLGDIDLDGLPDAWESAHGLDPRLWSDAMLDADGDGLSNRDEYLSGTDPQDPASSLNLRVALVGETAVSLTFAAVPDKSYTLLYRDALEAGPWLTLLEVPPSPSARDIVRADSLPTNGGSRFYRLAVSAPSTLR